MAFTQKQSNKFRTIGLYQPFASLMLHGKLETRWALENRKPAFPLGRYLIYSTKKKCTASTLRLWSGSTISATISSLLAQEPTAGLCGHAIAVGDLVEVRKLAIDDKNAFVQYAGMRHSFNKCGDLVTHYQWALVFENITRIEPFPWAHGKQGVGLVPDSEFSKIKIIE